MNTNREKEKASRCNQDLHFMQLFSILNALLGKILEWLIFFVILCSEKVFFTLFSTVIFRFGSSTFAKYFKIIISSSINLMNYVRSDFRQGKGLH